ncbi:CoB--CoM heterodisulfide reductase subunit B [candidate division KSB1 bacterium]|nr:CoB--CoM heterodisulfide reductase subunit B [candidate division KSB1 bacterium]
MNQKKSGEYIPFFGCMISVKYPQFEAAVRKTVGALGIKLVDVEGFTCCPDPIYFKASDKLKWLTIAARNLCLAEERGLDLITLCSGCTATLSETRYHLLHEPELKDNVNQRLKKIGKEYKGTSSVRHIVTVLRDDVGIDRVAETVTHPLTSLRVAIHYGCHLLKPSKIMQVDDPDRPSILENLVTATGAEAIDHDERLLCCGKACENDELPPKMTYDVVTSINKLNVDCMCLICPTCFDEYDLGQIKLSRLYETKFELPVLYYFQLLGMAQGLSADDVGLSRHKIKANKIIEKIQSEKSVA